jgi:outer membrane protein assembly factor BamA
MILTSQSLPGFLCRIFTPVAAILAFGFPSAARSEDLPSPLPALVTEIRVEGNERTETHVVLREIQTRVGDPYDPEQVNRDRDRIDNLDLFSEVKIDTLSYEGGMMIRVRVKERLVWVPTEWIPYPILNWSDETGWTYGFGLTNPNESGRNRSFTFIMEGGGRRTGYFSYSDPWIAGNHGSAAVSLFWSEYDDFEGRTNRWSAVALGFGTYLGTWGRARLSLEGSEIETDAWRTASGTRRDRIRSAGMGMAYDTRNVYADPRSGAYAGGFLERSFPVLDGTVDYASYRIDVKGFRTVASGPIPTIAGCVWGASATSAGFTL